MTTAFSPARSAFEGFRVLGRNPLAFLAWTALMLVVWAVLGALFWLVAGADIVRGLSDFAAAGSRPWSMFGSALPKILGAEVVVMAIGAFTSGVLYNAISRAVLRPAESAGFYLRFGAAEVRAGGLYLLFMLASFALIAVGVGVTWMAWLSSRSPGATAMVGFLAFLVVAVVWVFCAVRLCLAMPQVADTGRIDLRRAWRLSKGQFGPLIGMSLLVILVTYALQMVVQAMIGPFFQSLFTGVPKQGGVQAVFSLIAANWPAIAVLLLLMLVFGMVDVIIRYAPYAAAYRDLAVTSGDPDAFPASEF